MAKVRPVYDGSPATLGAPWAVLPLDDAVRVLDLDPGGTSMGLSGPAEVDDPSRSFSLTVYRQVVVEVDQDEARPDWGPGVYKSTLSPTDAYFRLQVHQRLGDQWRDEWHRGQDADGEPAMWLWAVLRADAPDAEWARENRERIQTQIREIATEIGVPDWVYVRFRKENERVAS